MKESCRWWWWWWVMKMRMIFSWSFWGHLLVSIAIFLKFSLFWVFQKLLKKLNSLRACSNFYVHAERTGKELLRMLRVHGSNWCAPWQNASIPYVCTVSMYIIFPIFQMFILCMYPQHVRKELMRALIMRVRNLCVQWAYTSGTDACTEHISQGCVYVTPLNALSL